LIALKIYSEINGRGGLEKPNWAQVNSTGKLIYGYLPWSISSEIRLR
jgi:hypothetical protein